MAEYLFNDKMKKMNLADEFKAYSFATSSEEIGNGIYPPVKKILNSLNINCSDKRAIKLKKAICMMNMIILSVWIMKIFII
ncbi:MAG: hypothetical protein L6U99_08975 [Clostridium sp.]|nr:MAG: hypothetical protein L6U99_08975 [Clostridium sp.]